MAVSRRTLAMIFTLSLQMIIGHRMVHSMRQRKTLHRAGSGDAVELNQTDHVQRIGPIVGAASRVAGRTAGRRIGQVGARNYGSLPLGYYRPPGPKYRPELRKRNVYHTETIIIGEAAPKPNALIPAPPNALVPWTAPRTALQTFRKAVPPGLPFQHSRSLKVGAGVLAAGAAGLWAHHFWNRDYSLIPVDTGSDKPGWVASTNDPATNEPTARFLTPTEVEELALETGDNDDGGKISGCETWQFWKWWGCLSSTSEDEVEKQGELPAAILPGICSDSRSGCDASSCGNALQRRFCAQTCGLFPCPPVSLTVEDAEEDIQAEPEQCVDDVPTCNILQCNLLVGRILCKKTCGVAPCPPNLFSYPLFPNIIAHNLNLTNPQQITDDTPVKPVDVIEEIDDDVETVDDLKENEMLLQWVDKDQMEQKITEKGFTKDKWQPVQVITSDGEALVGGEAFDKEELWPIKIVFERLEPRGSVKEPKYHEESDSEDSGDEADSELTDLVIDNSVDSEEVFRLFDESKEKPDNLWKPEEIDDELCNSLTIGAMGCRAVNGNCRCFFGGLKGMECGLVFPSKSASIAVLKNRKLALFPFDGCKRNKQKAKFNGEMYYNLDLAVYAYNKLDPSLAERRK